MASIEFRNVDKVYPGGNRAVDDLNLLIEDGEFMVLVGPSGCGKTTSLRMIAGLEEISSGEVLIGDRIVNDLPPKDRDIAMVFQNYALYPHMNVRKNLSFGLRMRKMPKPQQQERVENVAHMLGLEDFLNRLPAELSGGQRQRVAMGRAIVREPAAYLMDEPLSNLDAKLRVSMRSALNQMHERLTTTTVYVTHDQTEAMTLGTRVAVMRDGRLQQVDTPEALYERPVNVFVAGFIGSPAMNFADGRLVRDDGLHVEFGGTRLPVSDRLLRDRPAIEQYVGSDVVIGVRPPDFEDASLPSVDESWALMTAQIAVVEKLGSETNVLFEVDAPLPDHRDLKDLAEDAQDGDAAIPLTGANMWTARLNARTEAAPGEQMQLAVDTSRLHFFDVQSGLAIR